LLAAIRQLHRHAGEPSSRDVVRRLGRGVLSHTTANAVLRGHRVPRWEPLRQVVVALDGDVEHFRKLWVEARDAEEGTAAASDWDTVPTTPVIGRAAELDRSRGWLGGLTDGRGQAVLIEGDPGIGKSFLMRAVRAHAGALGCRTFWASCDELSQAFPLLPLVDTLDAAVSQEERTGDPLAMAFRSEASPGDRTDLVAAATERLLALVDEVCASAPVMLVVDDIQWADAATMVTLNRLVRLTRRLPLLVVMAARRIPYRRDLDALRRGLPPAHRITLSGLSDPEVAEFLAAAVDGSPGPCLNALARGAAGNPLYLTELIAALIRGGALNRLDGQVEVSPGRAPDSLGAAIADRLGFLSEPARDVLRTAALLGGEFSVSELMAVLGRGINDVLPMLDEAIDAGMLREDGWHLAFRHPLLRAGLYERTPRSVRAAWHLDAAKALAERGAAAERVARQLLPAAESEVADRWAAGWLAGAGSELIGRAPHAAVPLLRWVLERSAPETPHHDRLCCHLADALRRTGDTVGAAQVAREAIARTTNPDLLLDLLWTLAEAQALNGRAEDAFAALDWALSGPAVDLRHRARLMVIAARTRCMVGEVEFGGELAGAAFEAATAADDLPTTARALSVLSFVRAMSGDDLESLRMAERALAVAEGDPALADLRLTLDINRAAVLGNLDRCREAAAAAERVRAAAELVGNVPRLRQAGCVLVETLFVAGRWDDALAEADAVLDGQPDADARATVGGVVAMIREHRDQAVVVGDLVGDDWRSAYIHGRVVSSLLLAIGLAHERAGRRAEALTLLTQGLAESEESAVATDLLASVARLAVATSHGAAIQVVRERIEMSLRRRAGSAFQTVALHCTGLIAQDPVQLREAARRYAVAGRPLPRAQALEAAAVAAAGDPTAARTDLDDARRLYTALGAEWDLARTASLLRH